MTTDAALPRRPDTAETAADLLEPPHPTEPLPFLPYRFMAIDVGSNAIRYRIWSIDRRGGLHRIAEQRFPVRLGHRVFTTGLLDEDAIAQAVDAFRTMRQDATSHGVHAIRAVGTSALREARNRMTLVEAVAEATDIGIEVLPAAEEARLIALGVLGNRPDLHRPHLIIDIGGGSTEVILAREGDIVLAQSVRLGAVRLRETFWPALPPAAGQVELLRAHVRDALSKALPWEPVQPPPVCLGCAGTITTLVGMARRLPGAAAEDSITREQTRRLAQRLVRLSAEQIARRFELDPRRAEIIPAGALVLEELMGWLDVERLTLAPRGGVGDGLLQSFLERVGLRRSRLFDHDRAFLIQAIAVGEHYRFDRIHAKQVARLAVLLFDRLAALHGLGPAERRLLKGAALLHEIGQFVAFAEHHKHSYYLIMHADLPGLTATEKLMMALVARYHRKAHPSPRHEGFAQLAPEQREVVRKLAAILRIADALDREHQSLVSDVRVHIGRRRVRLEVAAHNDAPIEIWNAEQKAALFEEVFGRPVSFSPARS